MATGDLPVAYQEIPQVAQLWAVLANALAYEATTRRDAVVEQLAGFGLTPDA
jgi:hypothetical protein